MDINKATECVNRILSKNLWIINTREDLPDTFANDMQELFEVSPENDIISGVYWSPWFEVSFDDAVMVALDDELTKEEVEKKLGKYADEKRIPEMYIIYPKDDETMYQAIHECGYEGFEDETEIVIDNVPGTIDGLASICFLANQLEEGYSSK